MSRWILQWRRVLSMWTVTVLVTGLAPVVWSTGSAAAAESMAAVDNPTVAQPAPDTEQARPGKPVVVTNRGDSKTIFARHADGRLWRRERSASGHLDPWVDTGLSIGYNPTAERLLNSDLVVFAVDSAGKRVRYQRRPVGGSWGAWGQLPALPNLPNAPVRLASTPAVVANNDTAFERDTTGDPERADGRVAVFVRDTRGRLWYSVQAEDNALDWKPWRRVGVNLVGSPVVAIDGHGSIGVFSRNGAGRVRYRILKRTSTGQFWTSWYTLNELGPGAGDVAVAVVRHAKLGSVFQVFAVDQAGKLLTVTQKRRNGTTWTSPTNPFGTQLKEAVQPAPTVVAGPDSRLVVFAMVGPSRRLRWVGQTRSALPDSADHRYHNGRWASVCCLNNALGSDPTTRSMTVTDDSRGRLEVFAMDDGNSLRQVSQLAPGTTERPEGWWVAWTNLNPINDYCANAGTLECLTLSPRSHPGKVLEVTGGRLLELETFSGAPNQLFRLDRADDGTFTIVSALRNECARLAQGDRDESAPSVVMDARACTEQWAPLPAHLVPVMPSGTYDKNRFVANQFQVVLHSLGCLEADGSGEDSYADVYGSCYKPTAVPSDTAWVLGMNGRSAPGTMDLAVKYFADQCDATETPTCSFEDSLNAESMVATTGCVAGTVVYNPSSSDSPLPYKVSWSRLTGTEHTVSGGVSLNIPVPVVGLSFSFRYDHTWVENATKTLEVNPSVGAGFFGWVEARPAVRLSAGHWVFPEYGGNWTVPGQNLSLAKDSRGDNEILVAVTSKSPPTQEACLHGTEEPPVTG